MRKEVHHTPLAATVLLINDKLHEASTIGRAARDLAADLEAHHDETIHALSAEDGIAIIRATPNLAAVIIDWDLHGDPSHEKAIEVLAEIRARNVAIPVFLLAERDSAARIQSSVMGQVEGFIWLLEDTMEFISERVVAAVHRYRAQLLPPMFGALVKFARTAEYSWHTPGHTGGTAFLRSPAGRMFHEFFGEPLFRSDLSISVGEMGSLLDHSGPIGAGEEYAAKVFGADRTYYVTNGTSTSNRVVMGATLTEGDTVLCDRNCHKSVEHGLTLTGAAPVYLMPHRNHLGLIGPIPPARLMPEAVARAADAAGRDTGTRPALAIVTNSTYDGLCYNAARVEELLAGSVDRVLFDEAWFAYARFNPIYAGRFAMCDAARGDLTVFATQSTHKLLAALSQASMIHVRDGRGAIPHARFNEAFMMHASTSPQYAIIASADVSAAMMDGNGGRLLTGEAIAEAISFRQMMARLQREYSGRGDWFFALWQPDTVPDGKGEVPFAVAPPEFLAQEPACWELAPDAQWHGFTGLEPGYCMLDPIKVSLVTPGIDNAGRLTAEGIPAPLVSAYLSARGIVPEKTTNFTILFLFSIGVTKGKWGSLVSALIAFKRDFDADAPLSQVLPELVAAHPDAYRGMGLRELAHEMFRAMRDGRLPGLMAEAYDTQPVAARTPASAYRALVRGGGEVLPLDGLSEAVAGTAVVPYPPGIPLVMPGEFLGPQDGKVLGYLRALEAFDRAFPGFGHDTHGIEVRHEAFHATRLLKV